MATVTDLISTVHQDIIESHILTRLDGATLASVSCVSSHLHHLASNEILWSKICRSTWPSCSDGGSRSFFSDAYSMVEMETTTAAGSVSDLDRPFPELISAVDLRYRGELILSRVVKTETTTAWFQSSPLRIDLVDAKDTVATPIKRRTRTEDTCRDLEKDLTLSWIVIDPIGKRAANLSSHRPVSVQRNWISGEVEAQFATVVDTVECVITVVTCGEEELHVREVSLKAEKMEGTHLNGRDSLVILKRVMEGKRVNGRHREVESKRRHEEFMEKKREMKEKKMRVESVFDILTVSFGILGFVSLVVFCLRRTST
ncbi:PREDICTED: probable F-box protein At1g60180 [Camelina sativa]|uniref:Probable F-box protein At1g60180 n=1 Tax=Camelina sativa TaxID=90675 RepID=A0ABM0SLB0_CAMSA|nr:PREDICTED: probable F-box protein At1g60180 [Camelina sativa]